VVDGGRTIKRAVRNQRRNVKLEVKRANEKGNTCKTVPRLWRNSVTDNFVTPNPHQLTEASRRVSETAHERKAAIGHVVARLKKGTSWHCLIYGGKRDSACN